VQEQVQNQVQILTQSDKVFSQRAQKKLISK